MILELDGVQAVYGRSHVLHGVTLSAREGEVVSLLGRNGAGKSTTLKAVMGLVQVPGEIVGGDIRWKGRSLLGRAGERYAQSIRGKEVAIIFQDPMTSLNPVMTIGAQMTEVMRHHLHLDRRAALARAQELLALVGINAPAQRLTQYPHEFSGGMRQRVMIAMALACEPELLIADEPTTALDVTIQAQILKLLKDLQKRFGMALLLITHDLGIVRKVADRVCVMTRGEVVEAGAVAEVFDRPRHPYTRRLLAAEPKGRPERDATGPRPLLEARHVKVWFPIRRGVLHRTVDHVKAVDGVSIAVREGRTLGIVGESGSGKSSLALALVNLAARPGRIAGGSVRYRERDLLREPERALQQIRGREIGLIVQNAKSALNPLLTVGRQLVNVIRAHSDRDEQAATQHLALFPKSDLTLLYGIARILIERDWLDHDFIASHTNGFEAFAKFVNDFTLDRVAEETRLPVAAIEQLARTIHHGKRVSFWWTMGVNQSYEGVRTAQSIINLALFCLWKFGGWDEEDGCH